MKTLKAHIIDWGRDRSKWVRVPLLIFFAYLLFRYLKDPHYQSIFFGLNLGIHEFGHLIFGLLGEWWGIAGGTLFQLFAPLAGGVMFYRQRDYFAIAFTCGWLSTNLYNVAFYIGDARSMAIQLVSPFGGDVYHDWNYLLSRAGCLHLDGVLSGIVRLMALASMLICLGYGVWVLSLMGRKEGWE